MIVETSWLAERLEDPDLRIPDCSVMMEITDRGDRKYSSGIAAWDSAHIPGSGFVDLFTSAHGIGNADKLSLLRDANVYFEQVIELVPNFMGAYQR